jgi:hypothetical protein
VPTFSIRKVVNALIPDATPSALVFGPALAECERWRKKYGGLWVGGSIHISNEGLFFRPNRLNEELHVGLDPVSIPLADILSVRREFGWGTGIVVVEHKSGEFRFRCFGARKMAARISEYLREP